MVHEAQCDECGVEELQRSFDCRHLRPKKRFLKWRTLAGVCELRCEGYRIRSKAQRVHDLFRKRIDFAPSQPLPAFQVVFDLVDNAVNNLACSKTASEVVRRLAFGNYRV